MSDDEQVPAARRRTRTPLDAPERGSADELMDHGAAGELGPMRHSAAHVLAEAVLDLFPGTKLGIGPAIDDGFYYDFLLPRPLTPGRPRRRSRRGCARASPPTTRSSSARCRPPRPRALPRRARPAVQGRDPRRPRRRRRARRHADAADDLLPAGPVHRPVPRPARREHRQDRPVQAARHVAGAYWRGDEKRPMLQRVYGTAWATQEELDQYLWRREEAKKRDHRRLGVAARPVQLPRRLARARRSGTRRASASGGRSRARCASSRSGAATRRSPRRSSCRERLWRQSGHWDLYARQHVHRRVREPAVQPQADELPGVDVHLPLASCARTATCRCATASTAGSTATSARARCPA